MFINEFVDTFKRFIKIFSYTALAIAICILVASVVKDFSQSHGARTTYDRIMLEKSAVAINISRNYYINLSDENKIKEFIEEGKSTKGLYTVLTKSEEEKNKIFDKIVRQPNLPVGTMLKELIPKEANKKVQENKETVYGISVDFSKIR